MLEFKQRVRIVGPPGAWTRELAVEIAKKSNLDYVDLFELTHQANPFSVLQKSLTGEKWIVCGSLGQEWAASTIDDATMILFIDTSHFICFTRILSRLIPRLFSKRARQDFSRDLQLLMNYKQAFSSWTSTHRAAKTKMQSFDTVDEAYAFFVKETAPDLFL